MVENKVGKVRLAVMCIDAAKAPIQEPQSLSLLLRHNCLEDAMLLCVTVRLDCVEVCRHAMSRAFERGGRLLD